ncbi:hypothetical protein J2128_001297 [Methanomicrobium sp. W14]|uniref:hypothetical protein n=1 Tax=Methanomicrobium sp. W14 TaxID=2817839 RepID=UPI001AE2B513|nr:hypothetical protein [Methanomicrobium sp. W14]MBP2133343.1 hypothetical protein [Methanomicrobium sp. W14]
MISGKEEKFALMLLLAVLATVAASHILISSAGMKSFSTEYSENSTEGNPVFFSGNVTGVYATKTGNNLIINTDGPDIFFKGGEEYLDSFKKAEFVNVTGTVSVYKGKKEISVEKTENIQILITKEDQE